MAHQLAAGRPQDFEFCRALVRAKLITADIVRSRASTIDTRVDVVELSARVEPFLNEVRIVSTNDRQIVGVMNEFVFQAEGAWGTHDPDCSRCRCDSLD